MTVLESVWWYSSILKYGVGTTRAPKALAKLPQSLIAFAQGGRYATLINRQLHGGSLTWWLVLWASLLFCADFLYDSSCQMSNWRGSDDAEENAEGQNGQAKKTVGGLTEKRMFLCTKSIFHGDSRSCCFWFQKNPFMLNHKRSAINSCESTQVSQAISEMLQILAEVPQEKRMEVFMGISALYRYAR